MPGKSYGSKSSRYCRCSLRYMDARQMATISAIYTVTVSLLMIILVASHMYFNSTIQREIQSVYFGLQLSEGGIVLIHCALLVLSVILFHGVKKYLTNRVFLWVFGNICLSAIESVLTVYNTVLKDHVYKGSGKHVRAELGIFTAKTLLNVMCVILVAHFHQDLRSGTTKYWGHRDEEEAVML